MWSLKPVTYDTQEHGRVPSMVPAHTVCTDDHQLRLLLHIVLQLPLQVFPTMCKIRSADVLSGRHIVRVTFCHGFLIDVLSGRHFVSTYFVRHFVRKTFCQFSFFVVGFCIDVLSGRQIVRIHFDHISGMLTLFMVCLRYIWYFDHISGMLTLLSQKWPKMNQNGLK